MISTPPRAAVCARFLSSRSLGGPSSRPRGVLSPPARGFLSLLALGVLLGGGLTACGGEDAALRVGPVVFSEDEVLALPEEPRRRLAELTALGLAVRADDVERLGRPLLDRRADSLLVERFGAWLLVRETGIEEDALEARYATDPRYELVVRHVVALADDRAADSVHEAAREKAERALERLADGAAFETVAAELSEEPGAAERGGRLEPGREGSWVDPFWRAANSLDEGEHTRVIRTEYGYHVIRLEERRTVPFEEVRAEVIVDAAALLGGADRARSAWLDSVAAGVEVDTAAVSRFLADGSGPDTTIVATDGTSPYRLGDLRERLTSSTEGSRDRILSGGVPSVSAEIREDRSRARAADEARRVGLDVPDAERERLRREWTRQVTGWAAALGFSSGSTPATVTGRPSGATPGSASRAGTLSRASLDAVKAEALAALTTTRQNATIARRELETYGPLLRGAYPIVDSSTRSDE